MYNWYLICYDYMYVPCMLASNLWHCWIITIPCTCTCILLKVKLEWILTYQPIIKLFHQISDCSIARKQNKVVQWFVKPLIVISFWIHPVTVRFDDDFRFGTTTELSLYAAVNGNLDPTLSKGRQAFGVNSTSHLHLQKNRGWMNLYLIYFWPQWICTVPLCGVWWIFT